MAEYSDNVNLTCPICTLFLIEPVTLPCCQQDLCKQCLEHALAESALTCPFCRMRIAVWVRRNTKAKTLVNEKKWRELQSLYPEEVRRRMEGLDDSENESVATAPKVSLAQPGEIHQEYEEEKKKYQKEQEEMRQEEEEASRRLIEQMQEVGEAMPIDDQIAIEERMRMDEEFVNKLVQQEANEAGSELSPGNCAATTPNASKGKTGPLDTMFAAMKQTSSGGREEVKPGHEGFPDQWEGASSPAAPGSKAPPSLAAKAPPSLAGPGKAPSKPSAPATVSQAPAVAGSDSEEDDVTACVDPVIASVPPRSHDNLFDSLNESLHPETRTAPSSTSSEELLVSESGVPSQPMSKPGSSPAASFSEALQAVPPSCVKSAGSSPTQHHSSRAVPASSSCPPSTTNGRPQHLDEPEEDEESRLETTVSSSSSSKSTSPKQMIRTSGVFFSQSSRGSGESYSSGRKPEGLLQFASSPPVGSHLLNPTAQAKVALTRLGPSAQNTANKTKGPSGSTEPGRKDVGASGSCVPGVKMLHGFLPVKRGGDAAEACSGKDRRVSVASLSSNASVSPAPSSSKEAKTSSAFSPLVTGTVSVTGQKKAHSSDEVGSRQSLSLPDVVDLTGTDGESDMELASTNAEKQITQGSKPGVARGDSASIEDFLGMPRQPASPKSPVCSSFPLGQANSKPDRHPDLDMESDISAMSVIESEDETDVDSILSSSSKSRDLAKEQHDLDEFEMSGAVASTSGDTSGKGDRPGRGEIRKGGKTGKSTSKRKRSAKPASAAKRQKVDRNQPSLDRFFSHQGRGKGGPGEEAPEAVEKSQEERDMELARQLQQQFDIEARYRLTATRFKGHENEYGLRTRRATK